MADVLLDDSYDLPRDPELTDDFEVVGQQIESLLRLHRGEWLIDERVGFPWLEWFRTTPPPLTEMNSIIPARLLDIERVAEVPEWRGEYNNDGIFQFSGTIAGTEGEEATLEAGVDRAGLFPEPNAAPRIAIDFTVI